MGYGLIGDDGVGCEFCWVVFPVQVGIDVPKDVRDVCSYGEEVFLFLVYFSKFVLHNDFLFIKLSQRFLFKQKLQIHFIWPFWAF